MKNRKKLVLGILLLVVAVGSVTTWAVSRASTKPQQPLASAKPQAISTRYLDAFFQSYVAALNSKDVSQMMSFYGPDVVTTMAWGKEMNNAQRADYFQACGQSFPEAKIVIQKVMYVPKSSTSGYITWSFGMKAGTQVKPFMGVMGFFKKPEPGKIYDQEGVSTGQVELLDRAAAGTIKGLEDQIAAIDKDILSLDEQIVTSDEEAQKGPALAEKITLAGSRSELIEKRANLDHELINKAVSSIKFTRQSSYQNMDAFLKKIGGK